MEILRRASQLLRKTTQEGGNTTELDAVLRSHIVKHWKNGKFYVANASITTENPTQSFVDYVELRRHIQYTLPRNYSVVKFP